MGNFLGILAGASLSAAFVFPKPWCFVAAVVCSVAVIWLRSL